MNPMGVTLLSFHACPNAVIARQRLAEAFERLGLDPSVITYATVDTPEKAKRLAFRGSPSILINGTDPDSLVGLSCRIYRTDAGTDGAPSVDALTALLRS